MTNKQTALFVVLAVVGIIGVVSCCVIFIPAISARVSTPAPKSSNTPPAVASSPLSPIYVTLNVNEFTTYTIYWKRELWENAVSGNLVTEDFENDSGDYGELTFPYLTGNSFLLTGNSSAQIFNDDTLLATGNLIHFRDWENGLRFGFPNNAAAAAFGMDYKASETWQLAFDDTVITIPEGRNRFIGVLIHEHFPGDFVLFSTQRTQGGLSVDNISYIPIANETPVPTNH